MSKSPSESTPIERMLAQTCPKDTNGDGDCGQRYCPWCGSTPEIRSARFNFVVGIIKEMAADVWGDKRITEHAEAVVTRRWSHLVATARGEGGFFDALATMLALNWGWEACVPEEWPEGPLGYLDEHLHYTRGAKHTDLISDLRDLAMMLDPNHEERFPGGKANVRPRAGVQA